MPDACLRYCARCDPAAGSSLACRADRMEYQSGAEDKHKCGHDRVQHAPCRRARKEWLEEAGAVSKRGHSGNARGAGPNGKRPSRSIRIGCRQAAKEHEGVQVHVRIQKGEARAASATRCLIRLRKALRFLATPVVLRPIHRLREKLRRRI